MLLATFLHLITPVHIHTGKQFSTDKIHNANL